MVRNTSFENLGMISETENTRRDNADRSLPGVYKTSAGKDEKSYRSLDEKISDCFMEPGPGRVVVLPDDFSYKGRLIVPKTAERTGTTGTVLKVGYGCEAQFWDEKEPVPGVKVTDFEDRKEPRERQITGRFRPLRPGDRVAYGTWTGTQFSFDQRPSYRVLADSDIATILNGNETKLLEVEA